MSQLVASKLAVSRPLAVCAALVLVLAAPQPALGQPPAGDPAMVVEPGEITSSQPSDQRVTHELSIGNRGSGELAWQVFEGEPQPRPTGPVTPVGPAGEQVPGGTAVLASYRGFAGRAGWTVEPAAPPVPSGAIGITHSDSAAVVAGTSVACTPNRGITTTAAGYLRHFTLADFDIIGAFEVTAVSFAVESLSGADQALTVNLFTLTDPAGPFDYPNFTLLGTAEHRIATQTMATVEVPVSAAVPAGATLVVEVSSPDLTRGGLFIGASPTGQSAPSYLRAEACGVPAPTPTAALGLPDMHVTMGVTGIPEVAACEVPAGTPWLDLEPASGTVAPGETEAVAVTFDSAGHPSGDALTAELCLVGNDPDRPSVLVPLALRVEDTVPPAIEVTPASLTATLTAGEVIDAALTIANTGDEALEWEIETAAGDGTEVALASERDELLAGGVLLVPDSLGNRVMALDPDTGDLRDADFIPADPVADLGTPIHIVPNADQDGFWLSDQLRHVVHAYDLDGTWQGVFAPAGGADTSVAQNVRGIHPSVGGTLLVTVAAGGNAGAVAEFDADGVYTGNFVDNQAGSIGGPWDLVFRDSDVLLSDDQVLGTGAIHRFAPDGTHLGVFHGPIGFPQQMQQLPNGNVLVAQFSGATAGVWELTADGELVDVYSGVAGNRGVYELPNGNILTTNGSGVHEIDRGTGLVDTKIAGVSARFITHVQLGEPSRCDAPAELPWLSVSPTSGATPAGAASEVAVTLDAAGLAPGDHLALLCVRSNDPAEPLVEVPVSVTVVDDGSGGCDETITGLHAGPLTVTGGVTCVAAGARIEGEVNVLDGAGLVATAAVILGPIATFGATTVELSFTQVVGPISVRGSTEAVTLGGNQVTGSVLVVNNATGDTPIVVSGNTIVGSLFCTDNQPAPVDNGLPNTVVGGAKLDQCANL